MLHADVTVRLGAKLAHDIALYVKDLLGRRAAECVTKQSWL
jgi:hypothetical protein